MYGDDWNYILFLIKIHWIAETHPLLACYGTMPMAGSADQHWLGDILKETRQPQLGRTIFFHVTNCLNGSIELNNRYILINLEVIALHLFESFLYVDKHAQLNQPQNLIQNGTFSFFLHIGLLFRIT